MTARFITLYLAIAAAALLAGCSKEKIDRMNELEKGQVSVPFNPAEAAYVLKPGSATISGRVYTGQLAGEYAQVRLVPVTTYSTEVMRHLFAGAKAYHLNTKIKNLDVRYNQHMRHTKADANGNYIIHGAPPGRFYLYATAANYEKGYGFGHMETIEVQDGQKYTVDLDGQ